MLYPFAFVVLSIAISELVSPASLLLFVVTMLYVGGLIGALALTRNLLWVVCVGLFLFQVFQCIKQRRWPAALLRPELTVLSFAIFALLFKLQSAVFNGWDDYTNWAPLASGLVRTNHLTTTDLLSTAQSYPLAHSLWQYFLIFDSYSESLAIQASSIWVALMLFSTVPALHDRGRSRWAAAFLCLLFFYFVNFPFGMEWRSIYADHILGSTFAFGLVAAYRWGTEQRDGRMSSLIGLALSLFILCQVKDLGIGFAFVVVGVALLVRWFQKSTVSWATSVFLFAIPIISTLSWKAYCRAHHLNSRYSLSISLQRLTDPEHFSVVKTTVFSFLKHTFIHSYDNFWPLPFWIILVFVWVSWLRKPGNRDSQIKWTNRWLMFSFAGYALLLLFLYLTAFPDSDAVKVASYERYLKPFMMGIFVLWFAVSLEQTAVLKMPRRFAYILIAALMIGSTSRAWTFPFFDDVSKPHAAGKAVKEDLAQLKQLAPSLGQKRIWAIRTPSQDLEASILYLNFPQLNWVMMNSSIRKNPKNVALGDAVITDWTEQLSAADYLWVSRGDATFWSDYGDSFSCLPEECQRHHLFKIDMKKSKPVIPAD